MMEICHSLVIFIFSLRSHQDLWSRWNLSIFAFQQRCRVPYLYLIFSLIFILFAEKMRIEFFIFLFIHLQEKVFCMDFSDGIGKIVWGQINARDKLDRLFNLQNMLQKDSWLPFFTSCYDVKEATLKIVSPSQKIIASGKKKQSKISLKRSNKTSTQSFDGSLRNVANPLPNQTSIHRLTNFKAGSKENCRSSIKIEDNVRSKLNIQNNSSFTCQEEKTETYIKGARKQVFNFLYTTQKSPYFQVSELEKTTKISKFKTPMKVLTENNDNKKSSQLEETTHLFTKLPILTLDNYRQSSVSIQVQGGPLIHKLQQSTVMIDYFHPPSSRANQLEEYLQNRQ